MAAIYTLITIIWKVDLTRHGKHQVYILDFQQEFAMMVHLLKHVWKPSGLIFPTGWLRFDDSPE